jgi:ABC-type phosphate/phosphonate transport system substrate-binding protein
MTAPRWIAALPMYDFPELRQAHDALWTALASRLASSGVRNVPIRLTRDLTHFEVWQHPQLLLAQGCEYPLATMFAGSVRVIATPRYAAPGCEGASYRSAIVVRAGDSAETLAELRKRRCVINETSSNSGVNLLRAAVASLAGGAPFFESVVVSGSHRRSLAMVGGGEADVAAVDCVSLAHLRRIDAAAVARIRVLSWTASTPSLPFITARNIDDALVRKLRAALADVLCDTTLKDVRDALLLEGVDLQPDTGFSEVLRLERQAAARGFSALR